MDQPEELYSDIADDEERCALGTLYTISEHLVSPELIEVMTHGVTDHMHPACIKLSKSVLNFLIEASTFESELMRKHGSTSQKQYDTAHYVNELRKLEKLEIANAVKEAKSHRIN